MYNFNKTVLSIALTASLSMASTASMAYIDTYNPFIISPSNTGAGPLITGNKLIGNYSETITFGNVTNGIALGHFNASIVWNLGTIVHDTDSFITNTNAVAGQNLWALSQFNGIYIPGATTIFLPDGTSTQPNALEIFYSTDTLAATNFFPTTGASFYTSSLTSNTLIATGSTFGGSGTETCSASSTLGCGKFDLTSTLSLLSNTYFTSPNPFYNLQFDGGQFNQIIPVAGTTVRSNGSFDVTFANHNVPEPASLALVGLGLLSLGVVRRKKQSDALKDA